MPEDLQKIREERKWIFQQMNETVNGLELSLERLFRKLQENIEKEKAALIE